MWVVPTLQNTIHKSCFKWVCGNLAILSFSQSGIVSHGTNVLIPIVMVKNPTKLIYKVTQRCLINNKVTRGVQALPISKKVGNPCSYIYDLAGEIDNWSLFTRLSENQLSSTANFLEKVAQSQTPAT